MRRYSSDHRTIRGDREAAPSDTLGAMRPALLMIALAGCGFRSPGGGTAAGDAAGDDTAIDAAVDATAFDPGTCPPSYDVKLPSFPQAKYRIITSDAVLRSQHTQCTVAGKSHLIALETAAELAELAVVLGQVASPPTNGWYYVGAVQKPEQDAPGAEWSWLIGGAVLPALWGIYQMAQQPNDDDGSEDDTENLAVIDRGQFKLLDVRGTSGYGAVCECDGMSIVPEIEREIP
jgi:hypothetical protein